MAATKFGFLNQPNNTVQGYTLQGGAAPDFSMLGVVLPQSSSTFQASPGILVACLNSDGTLDTTSTVAVTIAIGTNPTSGSAISGTLVKNAVGGIACFSDLAITLGGVGYTLTATGSLTTATSNAFTLATSKRINPSHVTGTITSTGKANAIGPYRVREGISLSALRIAATSTNTTDVISIAVVEPGGNINNAFEDFEPVTGVTCPYKVILNITTVTADLGNCDVYVYATTCTGTISVDMQAIRSVARV